MANNRLFIATVILITFGVLMSYSLSTYIDLYLGYREFHFLSRQFIAALIGILLMWMMGNLNPDAYITKIGLWLAFISFVLMLLIVILPDTLVTSAGGARRWIRLPFVSITPSEFFKIGFGFFLAWSFSRKIQVSKSVGEELVRFIPYVVLFILVIFLLLVMQNDLGQVILIATMMLVLLICAGSSTRFISILFAGALGVATLAIITVPHRINRVLSWWSGAQDSILAILPKSIAANLHVKGLPMPYQVFNANNALINGGLFGKGLGLGEVKLGFLGEVHTDFVLAGIMEELGVVGMIVCALLFLYIIYQIFKVANRVKSKTYHLFCIAIGVLLSFSFIINSFGIIGIIPIKGMAVPFLSYGGSSLIANCLGIGMVLAISRRAT